MGRVLDSTKLVVRKAKPTELDWLFKNPQHFSVPYALPQGVLRKEWPCFVLIKGKEIIGYRSFEIHGAEGKKFAWVGSTSLKKGYEGKGLGPFLFGRSNAFLHSKGFEVVNTWAHDPRAKKFWTKMGYERVKGAQMEAEGNTQLKFNLKKQREEAKKKRIKVTQKRRVP